jgi:hypothetical protein
MKLSNSFDISINLFFLKLNLLVIKGEFDKGLLTNFKIMKKRTSSKIKVRGVYYLVTA